MQTYATHVLDLIRTLNRWIFESEKEFDLVDNMVSEVMYGNESFQRYVQKKHKVKSWNDDVDFPDRLRDLWEFCNKIVNT